MQKREFAVSEVIGVILLISVVITGLSLISVVLFSTPPPTLIPQISLNGYCCQGGTLQNITVTSESGDTLKGNQVLFYLDGQNRSGNMYYYSAGMLISNDSIKVPFTSSTSLIPGSTVKIQIPLSTSNHYLTIFYSRDGQTKTKQIANFSFNCLNACPY
jgi:hypothetical protein